LGRKDRERLRKKSPMCENSCECARQEKREEKVTKKKKKKKKAAEQWRRMRKVCTMREKRKISLEHLWFAICP
jgi:hypothetical protein